MVCHCSQSHKLFNLEIPPKGKTKKKQLLWVKHIHSNKIWKPSGCIHLQSHVYVSILIDLQTGGMWQFALFGREHIPHTPNNASISIRGFRKVCFKYGTAFAYWNRTINMFLHVVMKISVNDGHWMTIENNIVSLMFASHMNIKW